MLADALVYGLSLYAVGRAARTKVRAAQVSGLFHAALAVGVLVDVVRRLIAGSMPEPPAMIGVSFVALATNVTCLVFIAKHRADGAHMKASWTFFTKDVLANLGVIVAGSARRLDGFAPPRSRRGDGRGALVLVGAFHILRLR